MWHSPILTVIHCLHRVQEPFCLQPVLQFLEPSQLDEPLLALLFQNLFFVVFGNLGSGKLLKAQPRGYWLLELLLEALVAIAVIVLGAAAASRVIRPAFHFCVVVLCGFFGGLCRNMMWGADPNISCLLTSS